MDCPKCKKPMKVHYIFWVDPLWECTTEGCKMSTHKHRESKLKEVNHGS